ncbi:MAG TPA: ABC transporter permease [Casimicrobiaceae bacterium]|jgi:ABC-type nitrate/sulfonate/bicarbonate transport system permease component
MAAPGMSAAGPSQGANYSPSRVSAAANAASVGGTPITIPPTVEVGFARVTIVRVAIIIVLLAGWETLARSGLLFRDVVPTLGAIARALVTLLSQSDFYMNLGWTLGEIGLALLIGGVSGLLVGLILGGSRFLGRAYEPYLYYLGPTPKIIFFPVMIMWFGVGPTSKAALGALSCFFPVALSTAAGMRQIDAVLIRVGRSFRATTGQMVTKIYLPAMREPIVNGVRLGLGVAMIATLLAETKLSNRGIGYLIIQAYSTFDMPRMYAVLIALFTLAIAANAFIGRFSTYRVTRAR